MNAEIMAVGTELLLGDIVNTNAQYIARQLAALGITVYYQSVVGDNPERIKKAYKIAFDRSDIVITTGGLGPTKDDLTKEIAAEYFNKRLIFDERSYERIEGFFLKRNIPITEGNKKQAYLPEGAVVLQNNQGTAPGCIINEDNKILILLPGPPKEMVSMFDDYVVPYLEKFRDGTLISKVLRFCGIGEGHIEEKISDIMETQTNPTIALYAKEGEVIARITAKVKKREEAEHLILPAEEEIRKRLGEYIYGTDDISIEEAVADILFRKKWTIATAESCTGGLLAGKLINCAGISEVFKEGFITYSNEAKVKSLNVKKETIDVFGAVSKETAAEMAEGAAKAAGTNIGFSITGIAGPDGGTKEKPVGMIYMGTYINGEINTKEIYMWGDRQKIRSFTTVQALCWLRSMLLESENKENLKKRFI